MAHLMVGLLGPLEVTRANAPISGLESDKTRALLAYLATEADHPHRRAALLGLLWPDCSEESARHNLRQALYNIRRAIGDQKAKPPYLFITRDEIQFNSASDASTDVARFCALLDSGDKETEPTALIGKYAEAAGLYRGKFLQEFFLEDSAAFEEWALLQRESLHQRALEALTRLADHYAERGEYPAARRHLARLLELDPWREEAHREMMRVLVQQGQAGAALVQYETCRRVLADQLGVEPSPETRELFEQIRDGKAQVVKPAATGSSRAAPRHLPTPLTPFVGRERELAELGLLILNSACRCITLVGPGGIGKSRLALQIATNLPHAFTHGVALVSLASLPSAAAIVPAIADALGFSFYDPVNPQVQLLNYIREKQILLLIDNVEHLLGRPGAKSGATDILVGILQHAPQVKLLVTSREILNLSSEWVFPVEGLTLPPLTEEAAGGRLEDYGAPALFLQHARRTRPGFALNPADRAAVARLCHLVEGHPLALELAATWVRMLSIPEIVEEIEHGSGFLAAPVRDLPERHRSMRVVFDYSWQMLTADEQQLLVNLAVFQGGFGREAAEQVAGASLSSLSALVIRSLVRRTPTGRFDLHELIRQYAADRLHENTQEEMVLRDRHSAYYLGFLSKREDALGGAHQNGALAELTPEMHNTRLAWKWAARRRNMSALRHAAWAFWYHYELRNLFGEWAEVFQESMQDLPNVESLEPDSQIALGLLESYRAFIVARQGEPERARQHRLHGLEMLGPYADAATRSEALAAIAFACWFEGTFADAAPYARDAHALTETSGRKWVRVASTAMIGIMEYELGNHAEADRWLTDGLTLCRALGDARLVSLTIGYKTRNARVLGRAAEMEALLRESLQRATELNDRNAMGASLEQLAQVAQAKGDWVQARRLSLESIATYRESCDDWCLGRVLNQTGNFALAWDDLQLAQARFQEALQIGMRANAIPLALDALIGIGFLSAKNGKDALALEAATFVMEHSGVSHEIKSRAEQLYEALRTRVPSGSAMPSPTTEPIRPRPLEELVHDLLLAPEY